MVGKQQSLKLLQLLLSFVTMALCTSPTWTDPKDDLVSPYEHGPFLDVIEIAAYFGPGTWTLSLTFDPAKADSLDLQRLSEYVDIDTDANEETGPMSHVADLGGNAPVMGYEYYVNFIPRWSITETQVAEVWKLAPPDEILIGAFPVAIEGSRASIVVPRCASEPCSGLVLPARYRLAAQIGNAWAEFDVAPNGDEAYQSYREPADFDGDGDVDLSDFGFLAGCRTGAAVPVTAAPCHQADLDGDDDVDQDDFAMYQLAFTGSF